MATIMEEDPIPSATAQYKCCTIIPFPLQMFTQINLHKYIALSLTCHRLTVTLEWHIIAFYTQFCSTDWGETFLLRCNDCTNNYCMSDWMRSCFCENVDFYDRSYQSFASATWRKMVSQMKTYMRQLQYADQFHWVRENNDSIVKPNLGGIVFCKHMLYIEILYQIQQ